MIALIYGVCLASAPVPACTLENTDNGRQYAIFDTVQECQDWRKVIVAQHGGVEPPANVYLQCQENFSPKDGDRDETQDMKDSQKNNNQ